MMLKPFFEYVEISDAPFRPSYIVKDFDIHFSLGFFAEEPEKPNYLMITLKDANYRRLLKLLIRYNSSVISDGERHFLVENDAKFFGFLSQIPEKKMLEIYKLFVYMNGEDRNPTVYKMGGLIFYLRGNPKKWLEACK